MKIYKVGGAVRDKLLERPIKENDWVVVGATPESMVAQGFQPVGKDFPVFLHPQTKEEYALARTERKSGHGYKGFTFYTGQDVTLEDDLARRDLTINAMAEDENGHIIDPYGGQRDLANQTLRHVSKAFVEDPLRILRTARFAAKLPNFSVHSDTNQLMQQIVQQGEVAYLEPQRVWQEIEIALSEKAAHRFFEVLDECFALAQLLFEIQQPKKAIERLKQTEAISDKPELRWAAMLYDGGIHQQKKLNQRLAVPRRFSDLAKVAARTHHFWQKSEMPNAQSYLHWLERIDAFRQPERTQNVLMLCRACEANGDHKAELGRQALAITWHKTARPFVDQGYRGAEIAEKVREARIEALKQWLNAEH